MSRAQISDINAAVLDVLGLDDIGHTIAGITVTLHRTSWPTARLEVLLDGATDRTERRFVRLVAQDHGTAPAAPSGFDLDAECNRARQAVRETIENSADQALQACMRSLRDLTMFLPQFELQRLPYENQRTWQPANRAARAAFKNYDEALAQLKLLSPLQRLKICTCERQTSGAGVGDISQHEVHQ